MLTIPRRLVSLALFAAAAVLLVAFLATASPSPAAQTRPSAFASAGHCIALIQKGNKLVTLRQTVYKYKFKRVKGSKSFQRVIVRVRVAVRVDCAKQCVVMAKKRDKHHKLRLVPVMVRRKMTVTVKRGNRLVKVRKKVRTYKFGVCKNKGSSKTAGVPVKITVLPNSYALLDFGAFQRQAPITGTIKGFVPGAIHINSDTQVQLTSAALSLAPTDVFIDNACGGDVSSSIRTGDPTVVSLDPTKQSVSTLFASGTVTSIAYTKIHLPLLLRNDDDGCNKPYITTGYTEMTQTFFLVGKVAPSTGLSKLTLVSSPDVFTALACLSPGSPTQPCNGFQVPLPILLSTHLVVQIQIGVK